MTNSIPYPMPTILFHIDVSYWNYHISLSEMPFVSSTRKPMSILYQICKAKTIQGGASDVCRFIKPINYTYIYHKNISTPTVVLVTHQLWSTTANPTSTTQEPSVRPHSGIIPPGRHLQWRDNDVTCNHFFFAWVPKHRFSWEWTMFGCKKTFQYILVILVNYQHG